MIRIRELYKYYGARRAVGPLSAEIERGEVVGLLGLNGAGKTTTLRVLACDLLPSSGSVEIDGVDVTEQPERVRRMIGYLPDTPPLHDDMSVRQFLSYAAELRGVPRAAVTEHVASAAKETALEAVVERRIGALSHGYRQRVGIAQAIVHRPKLVVLDEPSGGLDPVQIQDMRRLVRGMGGERTVLVSSHNLPEISEMCDRLLVIGEGRIVASGTESELVAQLMHGERVELMVRPSAGSELAELERAITALAGVASLERVTHRDDEPRVARFLIKTASDRRAEIAKLVVEAGHDLLGLGRSRRELESVFAQLASSSTTSDAELSESEAA